MDTRPVFDNVDPPSRTLIDACVHCGFCLPTCPTYLLWNEEMDSPRGRIYLMKAALEDRVGLSAPFVRHFDTCLGCMACVSACPSGVQYGPLIERTRAQIGRRHRRTAADRLFRAFLFVLLPYPGRLRLALAPLALLSGLIRRLDRTGALALLPRRLRALLTLAPPVSWSGLTARVPEETAAVGPARLKVGLLTGCVQRLAFPRVNQATVNVLAEEGCTVVAPGGQGCCGALPLHAGHIEQARELARRTIEVFEATGVDRIAVNAAGCGSCMKEYGELLADDPAWTARARAFSAQVRDVSEVLVELGDPRAPRHPFTARVAYHDACHLAHAQGVRAQPRALLEGIPGIELLAPVESEICCGSAGIYNLVEPEAAAELGARKARHIAALAPDIIATGNPGCMLQIAAAGRRLGHEWRIVHPIELLDESIRGT
ncbi:MAG: 4Fe-4S dicluster domain-containing protein [Acidobacteria bacterium]|nr:4Fe-4S dicluster domain-containing protein [Acidobacteriota bacterium]